MLKRKWFHIFRKEKKEKKDPAALSTAISAGDLNEVIQLLAQGIDPNEPDPMGRIPIQLAIQKNKVDIINELCYYGIPLDLEDEVGNSLLALASKFGAGEAFERLLVIGVDFSKLNVKRESFLELSKGQTASIFTQYVLQFRENLKRFILEKQQEAAARFGKEYYQKSVGIQDSNEKTKTIKTVWQWPLPELELYLKKLDRFILDRKLSDKNSTAEQSEKLSDSHLLSMAEQGIRRKDSQLFKESIKRGLKLAENDTSIRFLFLGLEHFDRITFLILLDSGINPNQVWNQQLALFKALLLKNSHAFQLLLDHDADPLLELDGKNALWAAIEMKNLDAAGLILERGFNANHSSPSGSVLQSLLSIRAPKWISYFVAYNFDVNRIQNGVHAVDYCIEHEQWELLKAVQENGLLIKRWHGTQDGFLEILLAHDQWSLILNVLKGYPFRDWPKSLKDQLDFQKAPTEVLKKIKS